MQVNQSSAIETVHRLLFRALLEIRSQGHDEKNKAVFHLADLFHAVVLEMENAAEGRCTYEDVLKVLEERAKEKGLDQWFSQNITDLAESSPNQRMQLTGDRGQRP
jgi:Mg/Co/Ni transporter MgtE